VPIDLAHRKITRCGACGQYSKGHRLSISAFYKRDGWRRRYRLCHDCSSRVLDFVARVREQVSA